MLLSIFLRSGIAARGIAIGTAIDAAMVSPNVDAFHTATGRPLMLVLRHLQRHPAKTLQPFLVDAVGMANPQLAEILRLRTGGQR